MGVSLTNKEIDSNNAAEEDNIEAQKVIELANLRKEVLSSADDYDFQLARLLLKNALKPLDEPESFDAFSEDFNDYMSAKVVESSKPAAVAAEAATASEVQSAPTQGNIDYARLVEKLAGSDRLKASNFLIEAYEEESKDVVSTLLSRWRGSLGAGKARLSNCPP